jgi:hypothetical protein
MSAAIAENLPHAAADEGYVLVHIRKGLKPAHVSGRYTADALEAAQRHWRKKDPNIVRFEIRNAREYQDSGEAEGLHDDWFNPIDVMLWPIKPAREGNA